jgi:outer membrane protein assembly factor BamB
MSGKAFCADIDQKKLIWNYFDELNEECYSSMAVKTDYLVFGTKSGFFRCLDLEKGNVKWTFNAKGGIDSSPVISGKNIFVGSSDGNIYCISAINGEKLWEYALGSEVTSSPSVFGNKLVIGTTGGILYCFGDKDEK